jgi:hypothetical protein
MYEQVAMESASSLAGDSTATPQTYKLTAHRYRQVPSGSPPSPAPPWCRASREIDSREIDYREIETIVRLTIVIDSREIEPSLISVVTNMAEPSLISRP